jgi:hypothetical protein
MEQRVPCHLTRRRRNQLKLNNNFQKKMKMKKKIQLPNQFMRRLQRTSQNVFQDLQDFLANMEKTQLIDNDSMVKRY